MAISHVCLSCGLDLARVRALLESHYALPVVVCPDCGWAAVRRKHKGWRSLYHLLVSLLTLIAQLGMLAAGLGGLVFISIEMGEVLADGTFGAVPGNEVIFRLAICAAFAVALGTWLTAGFGHVRRTTTWLVFCSLGVVLVSLGSLIGGRPDRLLARCLVVVMIMTVATAGVPLGMLARVAWRQFERSLWRVRRRRLRARSAGR